MRNLYISSQVKFIFNFNRISLLQLSCLDTPANLIFDIWIVLINILIFFDLARLYIHILIKMPKFLMAWGRDIEKMPPKRQISGYMKNTLSFKWSNSFCKTIFQNFSKLFFKETPSLSFISKCLDENYFAK